MKRNSAILVLVFIICSCSVLKDTVKKKFCDAPYNRDMADLLKKYPFKYGPYKIDSEGGVYKSDELIIIFEDGLTEAQKQVAASSINAMSLETCNCEGNLGRATFKDELSARLAFEGVTQVINKPTGIEGVERNYYISDDILEDNIDLNGVSDIGKASNNSTNLVAAVLDAGLSKFQVNNKGIIDYLFKEDPTCLLDDNMGWNFVDDTSDLYDDHSHGTFVTSTIVNNANSTYKQYSILPIKVQNYHGMGTLYTMLCGLEYTLLNRAKYNIKVVNISMGYTAEMPSQYLMKLINDASNTIFVTSTGNEGDLLDYKNHYPSDLGMENIMRVAAYEGEGNQISLADFSNYYDREYKTIAAPGKNILGATPDWYCPAANQSQSIQIPSYRQCNGSQLAYKDGTSFSTAYVTAKIIDLINQNNSHGDSAIDIINQFNNSYISTNPFQDSRTQTPFYRVN